MTFRYKQAENDGAHPLQYGLIAEEVAEAFPELVVYKDGQPYTVGYQLLPSLLLNEVQRQEAKLTSEEAEIAALKTEVASLRAALDEQSRQAAEIRKLLSEMKGLEARLGVDVNKAVVKEK